MLTKQEYDRASFILRVARTPAGTLVLAADRRSVPRVDPSSKHARLAPVILLHYALKPNVGEGPDECWIFEEVVDEIKGQAEPQHTLMFDMLDALPESLLVEVRDRTLCLLELSKIIIKKRREKSRV